MQHLAVLLAVVLGASAVHAVTLNPGDILVLDGGLDAVVRVDPATGDRTVVSGCFQGFSCLDPPVGSGPTFGNSGAIVLDSDGSILLAADGLPTAILRIDPANGDRVVLANPTTGVGQNFQAVSGLALVPSPAASAVSVLSSWGLALILGISIGAWLQMRRGTMAGDGA